MEALLGPRYFRNEPYQNGLTVTEVRFEDTPFYESRGPQKPEPARTFPFKGNDLGIWAKTMAKSQESASTTLIRDKASAHGLIKANLVVLEALKANQAITLDTLELINFELMNRAVMSGVVRGLEPRLVKYPDGLKLIDLKETQMKNRNPEFWYVPAQEVPERLRLFLRDANSVGPKTPLVKVISLYREFIVIHPFTNGNGRTARVLVDYLMLKAGFPPIPHDLTLTRDVLHSSLEVLRDAFVQAFEQNARDIGSPQK